jgi:oligopeptide/dipeptide ABC transporter ATP-binding protein
VNPLLSVSNLTTIFDTPRGPVAAVDDVGFEIRAGETLGLVGESGSGKSVTALSIMRLVQPPGRIASGRIVFNGRDLLTLDEKTMRTVRGAEIALIFQEPMTALNPVFRIGNQIAETLLVHGRATRREAKTKAIDLLRVVRLPNPESRVNDYPHQLSGGMRQRVLIAMALACQPSLIIADEPTTALDVTIQAEILDLLRAMKSALNLSLLLITHDLGVIAETADRVAVMYAGRIVETGPVRAIFRNPGHPYTRGLLASMPGGSPGRRLRAIDGSVPLLGALPPGCAFNPRCPDRFDPCTVAPPPDFPVGSDQTAKCYLHDPRSASRAPHATTRNATPAPNNPTSTARKPTSATANPKSAIRQPTSASRRPQAAVDNDAAR